MAKLHSARQGMGESESNFYRRLISQIEVTESVWGRLTPSIMKGKLTTEQDAARNAYLARLFLRGLNKSHQESVNDLGKAYVDGRNEYPKDIESALAWITNRPENNSRFKHNKPQPTNGNNNNDNDDDPNTRNLRSFAQHQPNETDTNSRDKDEEATEENRLVRFTGGQRILFAPRRNVSGR